MNVTISEARLNDLVYVTLKRYFFEPIFGAGYNPRECDIRVVMNMVQPSTWRGVPSAAAILSPTETAPAAHDVQYEVETDRVVVEVIAYMEDHWLKQTLEEIFADPEVRVKMAVEYEDVVKVVLGVPEASCGPQGKPPVLPS